MALTIHSIWSQLNQTSTALVTKVYAVLMLATDRLKQDVLLI